MENRWEQNQTGLFYVLYNFKNQGEKHKSRYWAQLDDKNSELEPKITPDKGKAP